MKLFVGGRQFGKTQKMIEWAKAAPEGERRVILVATQEDQRMIRQRDPDVEVCPLPELRVHTSGFWGSRVRYGIDDLDRVLPWWFGESFGIDGPVDVAAVTDWTAEAIPTPYGPSPALAAKAKADASVFDAYGAHHDQRVKEALGVGSPEQTLRTAADEMAKALLELLINNGKNTSTPTFRGDVKPVELAKQALTDYEQAKAAVQRAKTERPPPPPAPPADEDPGKIVKSG